MDNHPQGKSIIAALRAFTTSGLCAQWSHAATRVYFTLIVPTVLLLLSARLVMTPLFLKLEYNRPGFPEDAYGFTQAERLHYAPYALNYLLNDADIDYLADLTFSDGQFLFTQRELRHMEDVKIVTRRAFQLLSFVGGLSIIGGIVLWRRGAKHAILDGLITGSVLTLGIISSVVILAITAWDVFFTTFHQLFFEGNTWRFAYSDTLIRLFPEQFWFDAAFTIGAFTGIVAIIILRVSGRIRKTASPHQDANHASSAAT